MKEIVARIILAYKRRLTRVLKRRSAIDRYKARQYYRKHKTSIKLRRKRYTKQNKMFLKTRKLFKRTKPSWLTRSKKPKIPKKSKPTFPKPKAKKSKAYAPKRK